MTFISTLPVLVAYGVPVITALLALVDYRAAKRVTKAKDQS